ncbi:histidine phosphatase family protein [Alkalihalobacillus sp. MEB130]|uniref:histidine phosphatase family protein n=1 Tax=Alkalihalobacillus sp. MEB130 TaxID=2976704 RepID=UPI0028DFED71|nr:histidine phosphatase family protein [Alkalihalobacillus sp. MEB130]MDT8860955.1 histidine phosphatase family protein [Alkalihalobacillus sp. MEB130]
MNLYLIRHGESEGNVSGKIQGWEDYPLSELGQEQMSLVANYFKDIRLDYLYSSDLMRAYETAKAIGSVTKRTVHKWEKVREVHLGPLQGLTRPQIYERYPVTKEASILTSGVEGTETVEQLSARCKHVIDQMLLAHKDDHVGIVSHGGFISIFLMYIMIGEKWHTFHRPFQINNTSITHIEWSPKTNKPIIHYTNKTTHLESVVNGFTQKGLL